MNKPVRLNLKNEVERESPLPQNQAWLPGNVRGGKLWLAAQERGSFRHNTDKRPAKVRRSTRYWKREALLEAVRTHIMASQDTIFLKEELAHHFRAKTPLVEWCFHRLNVEGILHQPTHKPLHDTNRDPWSFGGSGWSPDRYEKTRKAMGKE